jgi:ATP-binding cassette, subfamily F, member 3
VIRIRQVTLARGVRALLSEADASISPGERIALIGENGSGKSTLLAALAGEIGVDGGTLELPPLRIVKLDQAMPNSRTPAWRYVLEADGLLMRAERSLAEAEASGDGMAIATAHDTWFGCDGPSAPARARELLHGLGFAPGDAERPVDEFSGGWKMRLNLGRALMAPSDLLLLDEPTNHLDLDAVLWLERRLIRHPGTLIVVSHDRDFLDRIATASLRIEEAKLVRYAGGYSACETARAERAVQRDRAVATQQARIARLHSFVERFRAKATKARQAQSRLKALERIEVLAPIRQMRGIDFEFPAVGDCPDPLVHLQQVDAGYAATAESPARVVVAGASLTIGRGTRLGVLGRNGAGKTTLVRTLVGELPALGGTLERSRTIRVGYFAQQQVDALRSHDSALQHMQRLAPAEREQVLRDFLGGFAFRGDDATRPVGPMSGGERARLALAMLVWLRPQLLVLDEPTNHLDASTRDALADAMAEFDGALVLVSHDRYLLRATVDDFVRVADGRLERFDGDLDDYAQWLLQRPTAGVEGGRASGSQAGGGRGGAPGNGAPGNDATADGAGAATTGGGDLSRRDERRQAAEQRQRLAQARKPVERRLAEIDAAMADLAARLAAIDGELAAPDGFSDAERASALLRERAAIEQRHAGLEESWLEQASQLEAIGQQAK